jgi:hypothetical protein
MRFLGPRSRRINNAVPVAAPRFHNVANFAANSVLKQGSMPTTAAFQSRKSRMAHITPLRRYLLRPNNNNPKVVQGLLRTKNQMTRAALAACILRHLTIGDGIAFNSSQHDSVLGAVSGHSQTGSINPAQRVWGDAGCRAMQVLRVNLADQNTAYLFIGPT